jgi:elongation factor P
MQGALLISNYLMKISASDVRIGNLVEYQGKLWRILKKSHVKPGKGGAFAQLEMKAISDNTKLNERFRSEDKLEKAHVEPRQMQYLYPDGQDFVFMDLETFEQMSIANDDLTGQADFLLPNEEVQINFYNEQPIGIELPASVVMKVEETETVVKGQTAAGSGKPAIVETGLRVIVPPFVNTGDKIRINTDTGEYMERADS